MESKKSQNAEKQAAGIPSNSELDELEAEAQGGDSKKRGFDFVSSEPEKQTPPAVVLEPRYYASMWKGFFAVLARRSGAHWNLTDAEALNLGEVSGPVVDKYLPTIFNKYGAEVALASAVCFVCMPRMGKGLDEDKKESGNIGNTRSKGRGKVYPSAGTFKEKII